MDMEDFVVLWVWGFCGDSHGFFSVGMEWVWGLKSNSHGRPGICNCVKRNKEKNGKDMWKWSEDKEGRQRRDGCMKGSVKEV